MSRPRKVAKVSVIIFTQLISIDIIYWQIAVGRDAPADPPGVSRGMMDTNTQLTVSYITSSLNTPDQSRLIYVHGTPGDATAFTADLQNPIEGFESISVDRPGLGQSTPKVPALTLEDQANAIEPFLIEQGGRWPILIGHSMGGPIIAQVAGMYPDRVGGLVIIAGALDLELEEWKWYSEEELVECNPQKKPNL